jgi:hypothetical protein
MPTTPSSPADWILCMILAASAKARIAYALAPSFTLQAFSENAMKFAAKQRFSGIISHLVRLASSSLNGQA